MAMVTIAKLAQSINGNQWQAGTFASKQLTMQS
jgi:hypothetical protein